MSPGDTAAVLTERYETLKGARSPWTTLWDDIAKFVMPRRVPGLNGTIQSPSTQNESQLFDTTAINANMTLANGQLAWMSPMESAWFAFEPMNKRDEEAKKWLANAAEIARNELATSNFYTNIHEFYLDRGCFGTACLYMEPGRNGLLNTQVWPVGSFVIDEDESGNVDTVIREFRLTNRQAFQKFGENCSKEVKKAMEDGKTKVLERRNYLHCVYPRTDAERDRTKLDGPNMPIASVYIDLDAKHVCSASGFEEMPAFVSRYLEWGAGMGGCYGWSPAMAALPEARQVNFLQKMLDALGEKAAFPPVLAPEELEGEIDPNAHGVTYFSRDLVQGSLPKEWMTQGRYDIGLDRVKERQRAIEKAFHVELFQMFAQIEKQMTAREVMERSQEKLIQFSPTFARMTTELFNPMLERVFGIALRKGALGDVPQSMLREVAPGLAYVPPPKVQYSSRIALALRSLPAIGYGRTLERLATLAPLVPSVLDNYDFDAAERDVAMTEGLPPAYLVDTAKRDEMRNARAQAQAAAAQRQEQAEAADSVSKVGRIPSDSPVGEAIRQNMRPAA